MSQPQLSIFSPVNVASPSNGLALSTTLRNLLLSSYPTSSPQSQGSTINHHCILALSRLSLSLGRRFAAGMTLLGQLNA